MTGDKRCKEVQLNGGSILMQYSTVFCNYKTLGIRMKSRVNIGKRE